MGTSQVIEDKTNKNEPWRATEEDHGWARAETERLRTVEGRKVTQWDLFHRMRRAYEGYPPVEPPEPLSEEARRIAEWLSGAERSTDPTTKALVNIVRLAIEGPIR